jgi:hypothetical protein
MTCGLDPCDLLSQWRFDSAVLVLLRMSTCTIQWGKCFALRFVHSFVLKSFKIPQLTTYLLPDTFRTLLAVL